MKEIFSGRIARMDATDTGIFKKLSENGLAILIKYEYIGTLNWGP